MLVLVFHCTTAYKQLPPSHHRQHTCCPKYAPQDRIHLTIGMVLMEMGIWSHECVVESSTWWPGDSWYAHMWRRMSVLWRIGVGYRINEPMGNQGPACLGSCLGRDSCMRSTNEILCRLWHHHCPASCEMPPNHKCVYTDNAVHATTWHVNTQVNPIWVS